MNMKWLIIAAYSLMVWADSELPECMLPYNSNCVVNSIQPYPRDKFICSEQGVLLEKNTVIFNGTRTPCHSEDIEQADDDEFGVGNACGIACVQKPACQSWSWDFYNQECIHYAKSLREMKIQLTPNGPYTIRYFSRHCFTQNCSKPNLIANGGFEQGAPIQNNGSKVPDTWLYSSSIASRKYPASVDCSLSHDPFLGKNAYYCAYNTVQYEGLDGITYNLTQYMSAIQPNHTYSVSMRVGLVQTTDYGQYGGCCQTTPVFTCSFYGDNTLLSKSVFCAEYVGETSVGMCEYSPNRFTRYDTKNWVTGSGAAGTHQFTMSCNAAMEDFDFYVDDVEIREV